MNSIEQAIVSPKILIRRHRDSNRNLSEVPPSKFELFESQSRKGLEIATDREVADMNIKPDLRSPEGIMRSRFKNSAVLNEKVKASLNRSL